MDQGEDARPLPRPAWGLLSRQVWAIIRGMVRRAEARDCSLLILPFTVQVNDEGELNRDCIVKPTEELERRVHDVHVAYLRRTEDDDGNSLDYLDDVDELLDPLVTEGRIASEDDEEERQGRELFEMVRRIDP